MAHIIKVTYDHDELELTMDQTDIDIREGEVIEWIFHNLPDHCVPGVLFEVEEDKLYTHYYGPFAYMTHQIPGSDGDAARVFGRVNFQDIKDWRYRVFFEKGVGEDPFEEPYGNAPESLGKALVTSTISWLRKTTVERVEEPCRTDLKEDQIQKGIDHEMSGDLKIDRNDPIKVIPITQDETGIDTELVIHDQHLHVLRISSDIVVWDFKTVPGYRTWLPMVDFVAGHHQPFENIQHLHFGPFSSLTYGPGRVVGTGCGCVPDSFHYRVAMARGFTGAAQFKRSPDPEVELEEEVQETTKQTGTGDEEETTE
ncbi:MAG: hypothetical protein QNK37_14920 [Acidobacteriota bacterium]|nr:hypothetical protein [Acidobacteriota bacterium]